jgi:exosortase D (VPLPA-CTERM-specific)
VLYRGPTWHKAVLLLSAAPIAVLMNSFRIALVGLLVNAYGIEQAEGLSHLMEGWVVFLSCIVILFGLAALMLRLQPAPRMALADALDLDLHAVWPEFMRLGRMRPSAAFLFAGALTLGLGLAWTLSPDRSPPPLNRAAFTAFPRQVESWRADPPRELSAAVERTLAADDYISLSFSSPQEAVPVEFFSAWYFDQTKGGIHSPEVCLPGGGWEMTSIEAVDIGPQIGQPVGFNVNRAVITKSGLQLMVYYWFDQSGRKVASDYKAKLSLLWSGITENRTDGALVRLTTPVLRGESSGEAEARLQRFLIPIASTLPKFVDGR